MTINLPQGIVSEIEGWAKERAQLAGAEELDGRVSSSDWERSDDIAAGIVHDLAALLNQQPEPVVEATPGRFALKVRGDVNDAELAALRAALKPGDLVYSEDGPVLEVTATGALEPPETPDAEKPATPYGVRIFYADETMEEIHDIAGIQVANLIDGTFPVGFMSTEEEALPVAGYWNADGVFVPFEVKPERPGW